MAWYTRQLGLELGKKYPTIVFVYGGPHIQV